MTNERVANIHWLGHASFRIEGNGLQIYIDPWQVTEGPQADLILISHDHRDHCSPEDVAKLRGEATVIVAVSAAAEKLPGPVEIVKPGDSVTVKGVTVQVVPAYNLTKFRSPGNPFHPQAAGFVGFVLTVDDQRIYFAGDTDPIPEMAGIECDVALLPVSGIYVMTAEEAVTAVVTLKPKVAVPMHVGRGIGGMEDTQRFKELSPVPVAILPMEG